MSEKVTMRFEQFSDDSDINEISYQGPIKLFKTVETFEELDTLPNLPDFPVVENNEDNEGDLTETPDVIVFVQNVTNFADNANYRGAYFRYDYTTGNWHEILLGTHSHENKEVLDKIGSGDIGNWSDITNYPSVTISDTIDDRPLEANSNALFLDTTEMKLYRATREAVNFVFITTWNEVLFTSGTVFPLKPEIRQVFYNITTQKLFIFSGANAGDRKMLVLEVTDPDNTDLTYSFDVAWTELPQTLPVVPEETMADDLYLGLDSAGNAVWKNALIASQVFQFKQVTIVHENPNTDDYLWQLGPTQFVSIYDIDYNPELDEVLVLDGSFFLTNRDVAYNSLLRVLTVTTNEGTFDVGEKISVLIIRNGAAAILDELAADYLTKAEAINLLSGGSINLKNYATKSDLQTRAARDHTHSGYSKVGHDHDFRYANFKHTHGEYLTRRKTLELIQETLASNPDITDILASFSDYLEANESGLSDLITALQNISLDALQADITTIQGQIDEINQNHYTITQLVSYLNTARFTTDQIDTEFYDSFGNTKDLTQVLKEIREDIDKDLQVLDTQNVLVSDTIQVRLGVDQFLGNINDGDILPQGLTVQEFLNRLLRRRILPVYAKAEIFPTFTIIEHPEFGATVSLDVSSEYQINDSGSLVYYRVYTETDEDTIYLINTDQLTPYSDEITFTDLPITISAYAGYNQGPLKYDNLGDPHPDGRIQAGSTDIKSITITPVRAIFMGGLVNRLDPGNISSADIRSLTKYTSNDYDSFELEATIPAGSGTIVFAMPVEEAGALDEIEYREQFYTNILGSFSLTQKVVPDASGARPIYYNMYSFKLPFASQTNMHLKFIKR